MILITIGAKSSNRLVLDKSKNPKFQYISGHHAELLLLQDGSIYLTDKTSMNGTKVNGKKIEPEVEVSVKRGDKITLADAYDLDWNMIPIVPPIDPHIWDVYSIGTDFRNRVKINDSTNSVSRFHASLKVNKKTGKIFITDYSSNGTFVNGNKIPNGQETSVKWKQGVTFANTPLDWSKIKKPKASFDGILKIAASVAAVFLIGLGIWQSDKIADIFNAKWTLEKTQQIYGDAIVIVHHEYQIIATDFAGTKYVFAIDIDTKNNDLAVVDGDLVYVPLKDIEIWSRKIDQFNKEANRNITLTLSGDGTAFFVDKQGTMVTNRHITMPWESLMNERRQLIQKAIPKMKDVDGYTMFIGIALNNTSVSKYSDFSECSVLSVSTDNENKDIGLLRTKNNKLPSEQITPIDLNKAILNSQELKLGDVVYLIGYPLGTNMFAIVDDKTNTNTIDIRQTAQQGSISQKSDKYKFGHNAASFGGASGSPIFNDKGQLIGVHNSGLSQAGVHGYNWGILAKHAKELYDKE